MNLLRLLLRGRLLSGTASHDDTTAIIAALGLVTGVSVSVFVSGGADSWMVRVSALAPGMEECAAVISAHNSVGARIADPARTMSQGQIGTVIDQTAARGGLFCLKSKQGGML